MHKIAFMSALTLALAVSGAAFASPRPARLIPPRRLPPNRKRRIESAPTIEKLTQDLQKAGFSDVKVLEDAFLVQAKTKDGNPILMTFGPNGMSALEVRGIAEYAGTGKGRQCEFDVRYVAEGSQPDSRNLRQGSRRLESRSRGL